MKSVGILGATNLMMGARLRHRSPEKLLRSPRNVSLSSSSSAQSSKSLPSHINSPRRPPLPNNRHRSLTWTKCASLLAGLVAFAWLAVTFFLMSLHREPIHNEHAPHHLLPIPLSTKKLRAATYQLAHHIKKLPTHYHQLSPPTADSSHPWSWPIIHIVSTRFMQGQGTLVHLARSRLKLLEVVCLPSLMEQTIFNHTTLMEVFQGTKWEEEVQDLNNAPHAPAKVMDPKFLWIIKVDPNLDKTVLKELKAILEPVKQFTLVVGSNTNFGIGKKAGGWRDGQYGQDILDAYHNGQFHFPRDDAALHMLHRAHEAREDRVVLETRLDADDAVNVDYIAALQQTALRKLVDRHVSEFDASKVNDDNIDDQYEEEKNTQQQMKPQTQTNARWLYWCPQVHAQWNPSSSVDGPADYPGMLQIFTMPNVCVTAGLTLGFAIGTKEENVPRYEHSKVYWEIAVHHNNHNKTQGIIVDSEGNVDIHDCGLYPSSKCAVFVTDPRVAAFRSRAMTSAGMHNIEANGEPTTKTPLKYKLIAARLWHGQVQQQFGIETSKAKEAADFMQSNYLGTVRDNLRGQCTSGHSCKISSLEKLQTTIDFLEEGLGGVEVVAG